MKKKLIFAAATCLFALAVVVNVGMSRQSNVGDVFLQTILMTSKADGEINPDCPNGCVGGSGGCYCYKEYPQYKEASW